MSVSNLKSRMGAVAKLVASTSPLLSNFAKYIVLAVFLINWRAWPLVWHIRCWGPIFLWGPEIRRQRLLLTSRFKSKQRAQKDDEDFWTEGTPLGEDIFAYICKYKTYTSFDDSDYNLHLSNSSYGKTFDFTRFKAAVAGFPQFLRVGGFIPLAATHYHFIREIPIFTSYEIHGIIAAWDQKWMYFVAHYVTKTKKASKSEKPTRTPATPPLNQLSIRMHHTPVTPGDINTPSETASQKPTSETLNSVNAVLQVAEGYTLHTVAVSRLCFKLGRITVPPSLVFALNGFVCPESSSATPYSHTNPPPQWKKVLELGHPLHGGSVGKLREFLKGGWRQVPEGERWWEIALANGEGQRKTNLAALEAMKDGMDYFGTK